MRGTTAACLLAIALIIAAAPVGAETISGPSQVDEISSDASTLTLSLSVTGDQPAYRLDGVLDDCELPDVAVVANVTSDVAFDLSDCDLSDLAGNEARLELRSGSDTYSATVLVTRDDPPTGLSDSLQDAGKWAIGIGLLTLVFAAGAAGWGWSKAGNRPSGTLPRGKVRAQDGSTRWIIRLPWDLPGRPISDLDWKGGITAKLVFVGAASAAILAAGDLLDSVLTKNEQVLLTAGTITAALVAGVAPLVVAGFQADYVPKVDGRVAGDRVLVASVPGVVLASAVTAAATMIDLVTLWHTTEHLDLGGWSRDALVVLAIGIVLYCVSVAGSITLDGRKPKLIPDPAVLSAAPVGVSAAADSGAGRRQFIP